MYWDKNKMYNFNGQFLNDKILENKDIMKVIYKLTISMDHVFKIMYQIHLNVCIKTVSSFIL